MSKQIIMLLANGFNPDPRVYKEARYLLKIGFHLTILCWDREKGYEYPEYQIIDGMEIVRFKHFSKTG